MSVYAGFSQVYDIFMDDIPYDAWCEQTVRILRSHGIHDGIVADLGCGTGAMTGRLAARGYDMIGIDISYEMLQEAQEKREESGYNILYLCQDMREFELYGTCAAFVSRCDSINYLTDIEDLTRVFSLVNNYLDPGGIFIFDCNTCNKYRSIPEVVAENRDEGSFIWENSYDPETRLNEYDLTLYIHEDLCGYGGAAFDAAGEADDGGLGEGETELSHYGAHGDQELAYLRYEETHIQRAYTLDELKKAAEDAGLIWESACDADDDGAIRETTERMLIVLREQGKHVNTGSGECL